MSIEVSQCRVNETFRDVYAIISRQRSFTVTQHH